MLKCPHCQEDLEGDLIYKSFLTLYQDRDRALEIASLYGATERKGRWKNYYISQQEGQKKKVRCSFCHNELHM